MAGMAVDPVPVHLVTRRAPLEPLPQVDVLDRLLVGGAPAVLLPAVDPAGDAVLEVFAVGMEFDRRTAA